MVWFHGDGESGSDNRSSLRWLPLVFAAADDSPPFFILVTQHPSDQEWTSDREPDSDFLSTTYQIVEKTKIDYPIDPDRVYVAGVSGGGTACWELICRHPESFAAAVPMASSGGDVSKAERLKEVPIWAFHCIADTAPSPNHVREMTRAVQQADGVVHLTETPNVAGWSHDCWTLAIEEYDAIGWTLAQRRGAYWIYWRPGGLRPNVKLQIGGWLVLLLIVGLALRKEFRRRRRILHEAQVMKRTGKTIDEILNTSPFQQVPTET